MNFDSSFLANKTFLITGCNGFLGRRFIEILVDRLESLQNKELSFTHKIYAIDNGITSVSVNKAYPSFFEYFNSNAITFDYSQLKNVDYIIHMAGLASPSQYKRYPLETIDVAITLTRRLLTYASEWDAKLIFFSSSEVYGNPDALNIPTKEDYKGYVSSMGPRACYDESKRMGETLCYVYSEYFGVNTSIIRPFNVYGPGMHKHDYRMIPNLMRSAIENKTVQIYGNGQQTRTFCYLDDAISGIFNVLDKSVKGSVYNIGNPDPEISMNELITLFNQALDFDVKSELIPYPDHYPGDEPLRRCPDITLASVELGYKPCVTLEEGLTKTFSWCKDKY